MYVLTHREVQFYLWNYSRNHNRLSTSSYRESSKRNHVNNHHELTEWTKLVCRWILKLSRRFGVRKIHSISSIINWRRLDYRKQNRVFHRGILNVIRNIFDKICKRVALSDTSLCVRNMCNLITYLLIYFVVIMFIHCNLQNTDAISNSV